MRFYQLAYQYLRRKKGKTILLLLVLLFVNSMILSTNMILRATEDSKSAMQEKTKTKIVLEILKADQKMTEKEIEQIRRIKEVSSLNRMAHGLAVPSGFQLITNRDSMQEENQKASLFSYDDLENDSAFSEERYRLIKGEFLTEDTAGGIVMNALLADYNGLKLGDEVNFEAADGKMVTVRITGLFRSNSEGKQESSMMASARIENQIFIDNVSFTKIFGETGYEKTAVYTKDPGQIESLETKLQKILGSKVEMTASDTLYRQMKAPLEQIIRVTKLMLALTLITGEVVVSLLLCMWMRTRQKEIAVFISLGRTKPDLILQILLETLLVFILAAGASCGLGNLLANLIKNMLSQAETAEIILSVSLKFGDVISLLCMGGLVVTAAVLCSLVPVLRANPKDTLSKMEG